MKYIESKVLAILLMVMLCNTLQAQTPYLVKDINKNSAWSSPRRLTKVGQTLYFEAITNLGWGLWKSDGTSAGTVLLKSFTTDQNTELIDLADVNGTLYFRANDGTHGYEIWKSDGTAAGTVMVKDINPGSASSYAGEFIYFNNKIYFLAKDPTNGPALWTTDGTESGTVMFKDLNTSSNSLGGAYGLKIMGNAFYFWGNPIAQTNIELWKSDGTAAGTEMVKAFEGLTSPNLVVSNNKLFFSYGGGNTGKQGIWVSDGTTAGTQILKNLNVSLGLGVLEDRMVDVNGTLFFRGDDGVKGKELWKSDGTVAGTTLVKDIRTGIVSSMVESLTSFQGKVYFVAINDNSEQELWSSDGTDAGTKQFEGMYTGSTHPTSLYVYNNTLFFNASQYTGNAGIELWKCDGSSITMIYDINSGTKHSSTLYHTGVNNRLFFSADDGTHGIELWALDVAASTGFIEAENSNSIYTYPNPAKDVLNINMQDCKNSLYRIFDMKGNLVKTGNIYTQSIEINDLSRGLYILNTTDNKGERVYTKFVKE